MQSIDGNGVVIQKFLGQGRQGCVFKGRFEGEEVAVKLQEHLRIPEMRSLKRMKGNNFQNLIPIRDISILENRQGQKIYETVMELGSQNLGQFIRSKQYQECKKIEKIIMFYQAVNGVKEFHNLGYFHRDIKPENFLLVQQGDKQILKLCDFGIVQRLSATQVTPYVGSIYYMAPEVIKGKYDNSVDIWSLGIVLYEMLTLKSFFYGITIQQISNKIIQCTQQQINEIASKEILDEEERELFLNLVQIDPVKRINLDDLLCKLKCMIEGLKFQQKQPIDLDKSQDMAQSNSIMIKKDFCSFICEEQRQQGNSKMLNVSKPISSDRGSENSDDESLEKKLNNHKSKLGQKECNWMQEYLMKKKQNKVDKVQAKLQYGSRQFQKQKRNSFKKRLKMKVKYNWQTDDEIDHQHKSQLNINDCYCKNQKQINEQIECQSRYYQQIVKKQISFFTAYSSQEFDDNSQKENKQKQLKENKGRKGRKGRKDSNKRLKFSSFENDSDSSKPDKPKHQGKKQPRILNQQRQLKQKNWQQNESPHQKIQNQLCANKSDSNEDQKQKQVCCSSEINTDTQSKNNQLEENQWQQQILQNEKAQTQDVELNLLEKVSNTSESLNAFEQKNNQDSQKAYSHLNTEENSREILQIEINQVFDAILRLQQLPLILKNSLELMRYEEIVQIVINQLFDALEQLPKELIKLLQLSKYQEIVYCNKLINGCKTQIGISSINK